MTDVTKMSDTELFVAAEASDNRYGMELLHRLARGRACEKALDGIRQVIEKGAQPPEILVAARAALKETNDA